jgi:hypothetical protein
MGFKTPTVNLAAIDLGQSIKLKPTLFLPVTESDNKRPILD